jgi:hypothetical protein
MADLDNTLLKVSGLNKEQLEEQRAQKEALEAQTQELGDIKSALEKAGIVAEKNKNFLAKSAELEKASLDFNKKTAAEQERLKLLAKGAPLDDMAKDMGSKSFDGIKKFLGATTLFLVGVLGVLKLLQNKKFRDGVMAFLEGIKTVYENLTSFGDAVKDDIKGLPAAGVAISLAFAKLTNADGPLAIFAKKVGTYADDGVRAITKMFGAGGPPGTKGGIGIRSLLIKLRNIFRPITAFGATLAKMPVVASITKFFAKAGGFFKMLGKLFLPLTIIIGIWDTIKGAMEGYSEESEGTWVDKIVGAIGGGIKGLINSLVGIPLDFLTSALGWLLGKLGFTGAEEALSKFSWAEEFGKIIDKIFDGIKSAINWVVELFTDPKEALSKLWEGLMGEGGLVDMMWAPIRGALNWIKSLFPSWVDLKASLISALNFVGSTASWLWGIISAPFIGAFEWIKGLFPSWEDVKAGILTVLKYGTAPGWLYLLITGPLKGAIDWIKGLFPSWEDLKAGFEEALGFAKEGANWLLEIITKPFKGIFDFIGKIFDFDFLGVVKKLMPQKLFNWMFGSDEMSKEDIQKEIQDEKDRIARSQAGENEYYGREFKGIEGSQERIAELTEQLNEMNGNKAKGGEPVIIQDNSSSSQINQSNQGNTLSIQKETKKQDFVNYDNVAYDY